MTQPLADSPSGLLAQASVLLENNEYQAVARKGLQWPTETARVFEDPFGIVAVVVFDTWRDLVERGVDPAAIDRLLDAFEKQAPILEALDQWRRPDAAS